MAMVSSASASLGHLSKDPLRTIIENNHALTDEPPQYSLEFRGVAIYNRYQFTKRRLPYFLTFRNSTHLDLIVSAVVRVVGARFCRRPHWFGPEEDVLCTEAPDEDALIRNRGGILLFIQKGEIGACRVNDARGTYWFDIAVMILHGSPDVAPNESHLYITARSLRQINFRFHALDALSILLGQGEPADYVVWDVVFKRYCTDNVCTTTPTGKN
jgi:hypothetical protein